MQHHAATLPLPALSRQAGRWSGKFIEVIGRIWPKLKGGRAKSGMGTLWSADKNTKTTENTEKFISGRSSTSEDVSHSKIR